MPYAVRNTLLDGALPRTARATTGSRISAKTLSDAAIDVIVDSFKQCPSPMSQIVIESFHGAATRVAPTDTAYALRAKGFNILVISQWMAPGDDTAGIAWARNAYAAIQPFVGAARYVNYLDEDDSGDPALAAAYGPNLRRLCSRSRRSTTPTTCST